MGHANVEAIGEVFNLFNNINPSGFRTRVIVPSDGSSRPNAAAARDLLRRLPASGTARRSARRPVHVLKGAARLVRRVRVARPFQGREFSKAGWNHFQPAYFLSCRLQPKGCGYLPTRPRAASHPDRSGPRGPRRVFGAPVSESRSFRAAERDESDGRRSGGSPSRP